jgi:hypothetical protein
MPETVLKKYSRRYLSPMAQLWYENGFHKGADKTAIEKHLRWKYREGASEVWMALRSSRAVASCGVLISRGLVLGKHAARCNWGMDSLSDRTVQRDPASWFVFPMVFRRSFASVNVPRSLCICFPQPHVRDAYLASGWTAYGHFEQWVCADRALGPGTVSSVRFIPVKKFSPGWDRAFRACSATYALANLKTAQYLNWRFVRRPGYPAFPFCAFRRGRPCGFGVLEVAGRGRDKELIVADYLFAHDDREGLQALLELSRRFAGRLGIPRVTLATSCAGHKTILRESGFSFGQRIDLLYHIRERAWERKLLPLAPRWLITAGDGDYRTE